MQNVETRYKHVLVLTDWAASRPAHSSRSCARDGRTRAMNVSTVLIGPDAHSEFLVTLANWGKGRFYSVPNRFNLPEILLKQPTTRAASRLPAGHPRGARARRPGLVGSRPPTDVPPLAGYTETRERAGAETVLATASNDHPVLSTWRYGLAA